MTAIATSALNMFRIEAKLRLQPGTLEVADYAVMITDPVGTIVWVNPAFTKLTGFTAKEAVGHNPNVLIKSGEQDPSFYREFWATILSGRIWRGEMINRRKDGNCYVEGQTITAVKDGTGTITHFVAIKRDLVAEGVAAMLTKPSEPTGLNAIGLETVLVVDDIDERRNRTTSILRSFRYRVLAAASVPDALTLLDYHRGRVDLLFADALLDDHFGPAVTEPILAARPGIDVLYASCCTGQSLLARDRREHVVHVISKPYTSTALLEKVRDILDLRQCIKIA